MDDQHTSFEYKERYETLARHSLNNVPSRNIMAKLLAVTIILSMALTAYAAYTIDNCVCWSDYEAKADATGKVSCHGKRVFTTKPCNLPEPPRCICTEDKVTGILTDKEGTWCSQSDAGKVVKKWPCENKDAWDGYKVKFADYEKDFLATQ